MKSITVENLLGNHKSYTQVTGDEEALKRVIQTGEINRPGFELAGFFKHSDFRRIIVFGDKEMAFIAEMSEERQKEIFPCLINEEVPCIVICKGHECPKVLKDVANERNFPIFQTELITGAVSSELMNTLEEKLAKDTLMHGVFLNIHGKGVIIKGDSGIGKSEIALELVKRGHLLVADDAVELYRVGQKIVGKAPAVLANLLEIRGIGVIDVSKMFGISAILDKNDVDLIIQLERWVPSREYTRVGVEENDISEDVLGIKIPKIVVPVSSGRSMSVIIEAAVMNMRLRDVGIDSSKEFVELEMMRIKADLANSYMAYLWYSDLLKDCKTREEGEKVANDFNKSIREYINPLLKEISAKDEYLEVAVVRDVLSSCNEIDPSIFDFPKSQRLKELNEIYGVGERMDEEMTKSLYDELYAYGSKLKNADFKQAFLGRLEKRAKLMEGRPAIDFTVVNMDGKEGKLSDYKGKVLFVDFWATWCMPCLGEMPYFNELSKQFPNIQFVGISLDDNTEVWLNKLKGDADHGKVLELFSTDPLVRTGWDITGIPRFLLIDKDFKIISASAPRPSEKDVIVPLLEKYNKK